MVLSMLATLLAGTVVIWKLWTRCHLGRKLADARLSWRTVPLRTTRVTVDPSQVGQLIPVNDHLKLIRHASGHLAYLPLRPTLRPRPPMPRVLKAMLLTFFTL